MTYDKNIVRWIRASCEAFFNTKKENIPLYFQYSGPRPKDGEHTWSEFRLDGPYIKQISATEVWYDVEINILSSTPVRPDKTFVIEDINGIWVAAFEPMISVLRYGNQPGDDKSFIGCLFRQDDTNDSVIVSRFGQANPDTKVIQSSVEAHYRMKVRI
jgi:hypothetical protein